EKIEIFLLIMAGISLVVMLGVISYGIFVREVFNSSVLWTNDLASYLMVYLAFLAAPWVLKKNGHTSVDLFSSKFVGKAKSVNVLMIVAISSIACIFYFIFSYQIVYEY